MRLVDNETKTVDDKRFGTPLRGKRFDLIIIKYDEIERSGYSQADAERLLSEYRENSLKHSSGSIQDGDWKQAGRLELVGEYPKSWLTPTQAAGWEYFGMLRDCNLKGWQ